MTGICPLTQIIKPKKMFCEWPAWECTIKRSQLFEVAQDIKTKNGQLLSMWATDDRLLKSTFSLHLVFVFFKQSVIYLNCKLASINPTYPSLSILFPIANRLQRALFDLMGIKAIDSDDTRPWLRHASWPIDVFPLRNEIPLTMQFPEETDNYSFVHVKGSGVHEIPVGPVHAGIIEPGHFRFQVVGERILRLEERLGYTHKGIAKHLQNTTFEKAISIVSRISGDNTVAYAWSFSMAMENLHQVDVPLRAQWLRGVLLERERIMNHLGDIGALGHDAGLRFGQDQFSRIKEIMLRTNFSLFEHRYLMDLIVPGGVTIDLSSKNLIELQHEIQYLRQELILLKSIYEEHEGLQDRFVSTGIVECSLAKSLGLLGIVARASGINNDWRADMPYAPYHHLVFNVQTATAGDVAARVAVRYQEIETSLQLMEAMIIQMESGNIFNKLPSKTVQGIGIGCVEGWRGPVLTMLSAKGRGKLKWVHIHDPSWQNWLALEHAVLGNIVPDFPLINKSFNLSYSGHDG